MSIDEKIKTAYTLNASIKERIELGEELAREAKIEIILSSLSPLQLKKTSEKVELVKKLNLEIGIAVKRFSQLANEITEELKKADLEGEEWKKE